MSTDQPQRKSQYSKSQKHLVTFCEHKCNKLEIKNKRETKQFSHEGEKENQNGKHVNMWR